MTRKSKKNWWLIGLAVLIVIMAIAAYLRSKNKPKGEEVTVAVVEKRKIAETVSASGKVFPEAEVKISSDVSGEIVELYVNEGDSVKVGQLLAKIDPEAYLSTVERMRASVNSSKAQLSNAKAQVQNAIAQKEQIMAQVQNAETIHTRNTSLFQDGVISEAEYQQSEATLNQLKANLKAAQASIQSAEDNVDAARYTVKSAEANLNETRTNLSRTSIQAPTTGVVSSLSVEQGERVVGTIQMAGTEMMRIANFSSMEVQVNVSENDILRVELGDEVDIHVDAYIDKVFKGVVTEIANSASNTTTAANTLSTDQVTNFIVKIRINPESYASLMGGSVKYPFRPGMSASVDIYTEIEEHALSIPIQAVTVREIDEDEERTDENLQEVTFVVKGDTVEMRKVTTGIQDNTFIEVLSGLEEGETVVEGPYSVVSKELESGSKVRAKEEKKKDSE